MMATDTKMAGTATTDHHQLHAQLIKRAIEIQKVADRIPWAIENPDIRAALYRMAKARLPESDMELKTWIEQAEAMLKMIRDMLQGKPAKDIPLKFMSGDMLKARAMKVYREIRDIYAFREMLSTELNLEAERMISNFHGFRWWRKDEYIRSWTARAEELLPTMQAKFQEAREREAKMRQLRPFLRQVMDIRQTFSRLLHKGSMADASIRAWIKTAREQEPDLDKEAILAWIARAKQLLPVVETELKRVKLVEEIGYAQDAILREGWEPEDAWTRVDDILTAVKRGWLFNGLTSQDARFADRAGSCGRISKADAELVMRAVSRWKERKRSLEHLEDYPYSDSQGRMFSKRQAHERSNAELQREEHYGGRWFYKRMLKLFKRHGWEFHNTWRKELKPDRRRQWRRQVKRLHRQLGLEG